MAKYKNFKELAEAFKAGDLKGWVLVLDNDSTSLSWRGGMPDGIEPDTDAGKAYGYQKYDESHELYDGSEDTYILPQLFDMVGIPHDEA